VLSRIVTGADDSGVKTLPAAGTAVGSGAAADSEVDANALLTGSSYFSGSTNPSMGRARRWWRRPFVACLALLACYALLSTLNDPRGVLGADSGGKLATLRAMEHNGGLDPDVGYWAAPYDHTGALHPLYYTAKIGDRWVQVTTLPMIDLAAPLYELGGLRAVLLLPMLGALLTALAARALHRRLVGGSGWVAFWVFGLATPVAIYALDFWEHALGLALVVWAVVLLFDVLDERGGWRGALGAGLLFGAAAALRTEALVYLAVAVAAFGVTALFRRRRLVEVSREAFAVVVGTGAALVLNQVWEQIVLGQGLRAARAAGTAGHAGTDLGTRVREALTTALGTNGFNPSTEVVVGVAIVLLVGGGAAALLADERWRLFSVGAFALAGLLYVVRFGIGLGYLPGVLTASPLAACGFVLGWRVVRARFLVVVATVALPIVWVTQYSGNMRPQWGGRYLLASGVLLAVVAVVTVAQRRVALVAVVILAGLVTLAGVALLAQRSHRIADGMEAIVSRHDTVLVSTDGHLLREGGAFYRPDRHWLTVTNPTQLRRAAVIARDSGADELGLIVEAAADAPARLGDFRRGGRQAIEVRPGETLQVVTYRRQ
jgi:hypothetical protein